MSGDLLTRILAPNPPAFAVLHRPEGGRPDDVDIMVGDITLPGSLAEVPLRERPAEGPEHDVLLMVPYRQLAERGFDAPDDGSPLIALSVSQQEKVAVSEVLRRIPDAPIRLSQWHFDISDDEYADMVARMVADEIGTGEGANFVAKRTVVAELDGYSPTVALALFRRLMQREQGAYWTFAVHTGSRTFVGATPERHISVRGGTAVMNPISGTYRYPGGTPTLDGVLEFLRDRKETDELYMVLDEELKMMAQICESGGWVVGPQLKEMARLAHTEYFIEGRTDRDPREILRQTMFAPTVTGSPIESAARVIARYEPQGRGYYSGIAALIGWEADGRRALDSAIVIRTADIDAAGRLRIAVGATVVRHSDPASEVAETRAKAAALLDALQADPGERFATHPAVQDALARRNTGIADFWLRGATAYAADRPEESGLTGLRVLIVDAEDDFTAMMAHQLSALGLRTEVRRFDEPLQLGSHDLVVMGPGPGDPGEATDPKIAALARTIDTLLAERLPFVAVCLSHQILSLRLGFELIRRAKPNQGVQKEIDLFGIREHVGFYNTFSAVSTEDKRDVADVGPVLVSRDPDTGQVHALRGRHFSSMQFHAESVLTVDGPRLIAEAVQAALGR